MVRKKNQYNLIAHKEPEKKSLEKKSRLGLVLTSKAISSLSQMAKKFNLSKSELIENLARGLIKISEVNEGGETVLEIESNFHENTTDITAQKEILLLSNGANSNNEQDNSLLNQKIQTLEDQLKSQEILIEEKDNLLKTLNNNLNNKNKLIEDLQSQLNLQKESVERLHEINLVKETIEELQHKINSYHHLKRQFEEKALLVSYLQKKLQKVQKSNHEYDSIIIKLQQELQTQTKQVETLTKQLNHQKFTFDDTHKNHGKLQEQTKRQIQEINLLKQEIISLKNKLQTEVNETNFLQKKLNQQENQIEPIQTKLNQTQNLLTEKDYSHALILQDNNSKIEQIIQLQTEILTINNLLKTEVKNNILLKDNITKQELIINNLQEQINSLRSLANFGETQLNKWQKRSF
jgi:golgin subfamily B member 1